MALRLIFEGVQNATDDIFGEKAEKYQGLEEFYRNRLVLRLDLNKDGQTDVSEIGGHPRWKGIPPMRAVLDYCRTRMIALGRTEWQDPDFKTIPRTKLSTSFQLELGQARGISNNQDHQTIEQEVTVNIPFAASRRPTDTVNEAIVFGESVIAAFLAAENRLTQATVKNVRFDTMRVEAIADSNDNAIRVQIVFSMLVILSTR